MKSFDKTVVTTIDSSPNGYYLDKHKEIRDGEMVYFYTVSYFERELVRTTNKDYATTKFKALAYKLKYSKDNYLLVPTAHCKEAVHIIYNDGTGEIYIGFAQYDKTHSTVSYVVHTNGDEFGRARTFEEALIMLTKSKKK